MEIKEEKYERANEINLDNEKTKKINEKEEEIKEDNQEESKETILN